MQGTRFCLLTASLLLGLHAAATGQPSDAPAVPVVDTPEGRQAFEHLPQHYEKIAPCPSCREAASQLDDEDEATRLHARAYVLALFRQAAADERNRRLGNVLGNVVYPRPEGRAAEFREYLAHALYHDSHGPGALESLSWLLREERRPGALSSALRVLRRLQTPEASALICEALSPPHPNQEVLVGALEEVGSRHLRSALPQVLPLCAHHREAVREVARSVAAQLGAGELPEFKPEQALSPWLIGELVRVRSMVYAAVPEDAEWHRFEPAQTQDFYGHPFTADSWSGWLIHGGGGKLGCIDDTGEERIVSIDAVATRARPIRDEVARFLNPPPRRSDAPFRPHYWSEGFAGADAELSMILIAAWAEGRGEKTTAAPLILKCLDDWKDDRELHEKVRMELGMRYLYRMFEEFSLRRDYPAARAIGRHLCRAEFDGFLHQPVARELAEQLAARAGDFTSLVLPTPTVWAGIRECLDRPGQIRFLADRLRLIRAKQSMWPGNVRFEHPQYAEPPADRPSQPQGPEVGTPVIHPVTELKALSLEPSDLPLLATGLECDDFLPSWSGDHPRGWDPHLHRVREVIADLIETVAGRVLFYEHEFARKRPSARRACLDEIFAWCRSHATMSWEEVRLETMKETPHEWIFLQAADQLLKRGSDAVAPALLKRWNEFPRKQGEVLSRLYRTRSPEVTAAARSWITLPDAEIRFWGATILVRDTSGGEAGPVQLLRDLFAEDTEGRYRRESFDALFDTDREECRALACSVLESPRFVIGSSGDDSRLRRMFEASRPEALEFALKTLDDTRLSEVSTCNMNAPEGEQSVDLEVRDLIAWAVAKWLDVDYDHVAPAESRTARIEELKDLLRSRVARARAAPPPANDAGPSR